jgi:hypothetical protein
MYLLFMNGIYQSTSKLLVLCCCDPEPANSMTMDLSIFVLYPYPISHVFRAKNLTR